MRHTCSPRPSPSRTAWFRRPLLGLLAGIALFPALFAAAPVGASTIGEQRTALVLVNFQDDRSEPLTPAAAHALLFGQVGDYYWEASYQRTLLSGATHGWYALPLARTCDTGAISSAARAAVAAAGVDLSSYSRVVFAYPRILACGVSGTATVGGTEIFINGGFNVANIAHELGHSFGLQHSNYLRCSDTPITGTCTVNEYGDVFDAMGSTGYAAHFNAFQKERLGWLGASGAPAVATVQASGSFAVAPFAAATGGARALKVLRGTDPVTGARSWYYLEYRQPVGYDAALAGIAYTNVTRGILVHLVTEGDSRSSRMLDMTPHSNTAYDNRNDAALVVGQSFVDAGAGITITTRSADAGGAVVDVVLAAAACVRAAPTLGLSGPGGALPAGTAANYTLTVVNRDSAACPATRFDLAATLPVGWSGNLAASSLSLAPGGSGSTTLTVSSPASAAAGSYAVGVGAVSGAGAIHATSASATYSVAAAAPLATAVASDKTQYLRGDTVYLSARISSGASVVAGAGVEFRITSPGGVASVLRATSGVDGFARTTYKLGKAKSAIGGYAVLATATSGGASAASSHAFSAK